MDSLSASVFLDIKWGSLGHHPAIFIRGLDEVVHSTVNTPLASFHKEALSGLSLFGGFLEPRVLVGVL